MGLLEEIKQKPEEERVALSFIMALLVVIVLFAIWAFSFFIKGKSILLNTQQNKEAQQASALTPIKKEFDKVESSLSETKEIYTELKDKLYPAGLNANLKDAGLKENAVTENFFKIYSDKNETAEDSSIYIEDPSNAANRKSLINEIGNEIPDVLDFPY